MKRLGILLLTSIFIGSCVNFPKPKVNPKEVKKESKSEKTSQRKKVREVKRKGAKPVRIKLDYTYYYALYLNFASKGDNLNAYKAIKKAYELSKRTDLGIETARLAASLHKFDEAKEILQSILKKEPRNVEALKLLAGICVVERDFKCAEELYRKVLNEKKDRDTYVFLSNLFINEKKYNEALKFLKEAERRLCGDFLKLPLNLSLRTDFTFHYFVEGNYCLLVLLSLFVLTKGVRVNRVEVPCSLSGNVNRFIEVSYLLYYRF
jgi:tetratricopeptide (TPR) repeat protein